MASQHAAKLTIHGANKMTTSGRKAIASWLRKQAAFLEKEADNFAARFTARYMKELKESK